MVDNSCKHRAERSNGFGTTEDDRGQVILIGAITLAFIILGVVIVFNGILYTDGLSSGTTSQTADDATVTEIEIKQGVGCLIEKTDEEDEDTVETKIADWGDEYQDSRAQSTPIVVSIDEEDVDFDGDEATVTVTYDSHDLSYEPELTIDDSDCPGDGE